VLGLDEALELAVESAREPSGVVRLAAPPELAGRLAGLVGTFVAHAPEDPRRRHHHGPRRRATFRVTTPW
jgi:hypothetical protein